MTDDERFDEFLRDAAQDYNRPPETPREAMWARIEAARHARSGIRTPRHVERHWWLWVTGIAATLLLGISIGRFTVSSDPRQTATVGTHDRDTAPSARVAIAVDPNDTADATRGALPAETARRRVDLPRRPSEVGPPSHNRLERGSAIVSAPYQAVALQHLGRSEALLTSFRADTRTGRPDAQISGWARELLSTTRLLLDSPAASDARMGRLLADLELVLAQIANLPAGQGTGELELIDQAVEQRDVLFRLRATVPTGIARAGT